MAPAAKLCCGDEDRSPSPPLPNARMSSATPKRPLLRKTTPGTSPGSRFTSARSEDLHELRQIFDSAKDSPSPQLKKRKSTKKGSTYSLRSLLGKKRSKEIKSKPSSVRSKKQPSKPFSSRLAPDTVLRTPNEGPNLQVKITKSDLRKDLLSDKCPEDGGYDPDAEVLDDAAKQVGRKCPSKRPSLHSIEWVGSPPPVHKRTPDSVKNRRAMDKAVIKSPHHHRSARTSIGATKVLKNASTTPNLRPGTVKSKENKPKRSHSATRLRDPSPSNLSIRLPSLEKTDSQGPSWSATLQESLRFSDFSLPDTRPSADTVRPQQPTDAVLKVQYVGPSDSGESASGKQRRSISAPVKPQIHVQEPTTVRDMSAVKESRGEEVRDAEDRASLQCSPTSPQSDDTNHRRSVHLYNMRISHHLRSASLMSWDAQGSPEVLSRTSTRADAEQQLDGLSPVRHSRQKSSSGFASFDVPSTWGNVVAESARSTHVDLRKTQTSSNNRAASTGNLCVPVKHDSPGSKTIASSSQSAHKFNPSISSIVVDPDATPKPARRKVSHAKTSMETSRKSISGNLPRNNSVATTKRSKFREEFSPAPPHKKSSPALSLMKMLRPRPTARSRSEGNLHATKPSVDGSLEVPGAMARDRRLSVAQQRERRLSVAPRRDRSLSVAPPQRARRLSVAAEESPKGLQVEDPFQRERRKSVALQVGQKSLQTEERGGPKDKEANPLWERALKTYQDERSAMLLPQHKAFPSRTPFRERSGSVNVAAMSIHSASPGASRAESPEEMDPFSVSGDDEAGPSSPRPSARRSALLQAEPAVTTAAGLRSRRSALMQATDAETEEQDRLRAEFERQQDDPETLGAWGRYPSHTREERAGSAGPRDSVTTRDFALEAAISFAKGEDEEIDPMELGPVSPPSGKKKKRVGTTRMSKSNSTLSLGKTLMKNYTKIFKSQSVEFQRHGYGHRSSIAAGGNLAFPELELLPSVWGDVNEESAGPDEEPPRLSDKGKGKQKAQDSASTLRASGHLSLDGVTDGGKLDDPARVWSSYYEDCISAFPRPSTGYGSISQPDLRQIAEEDNVDMHEFGQGSSNFRTSRRHSFDSRHASMHSLTLHSRFQSRHSRHESRLSRLSLGTRGSFFSQLESDDELDTPKRTRENTGEGSRSVISVRKSTLDLMNLYREQERAERERLMRRQSIRVV
ncbi:hypothetical protein M011DRAFT_481604 [Sporormia fimetaria CBS 119925]|uniref:Uncharacterized protein n=1 Tax=Sporormia fimetaria CBS 119925 TaxID=1340428 RepID=A0A6A6UWB5_9PLEO|nr:hypothetical protein M011DRAFT_481604 [Sporormia fimetaria CBS 119925]